MDSVRRILWVRKNNFTMKKSSFTYKDGLKDGIPIALGYLFVSMGFGITAVNYGIPVLFATVISAVNITSAGQVAGIEIIRDVLSGAALLGVSLGEMILTQLVINLRYSLMSIGLSQKLDDSFTTGRRLPVSFFITDEIYAVSSQKKGTVGSRYMFGIGTLPIAGWIAGTFIGALAASWLPAELSNIFGIAIYGMFMSIVIPPAKKDKGIMMCAVTAMSISCAIRFIPCFSFITSGFSIIISALAAATLCAIVKPVREEEADG